MGLFDLIRRGIKNLWRRKARSILTIIAVLIGSTAVVAMLILAFGVRDVFLGQLESAGLLNRITVIGYANQEINTFSGGGEEQLEKGTKLTEEMVNYFKELPDVSGVVPQTNPNIFKSVHLKDGDGKKYRTNVQGIRPDPAFDVSLAAGRNLQDNELDKFKIVLANKHLEQFGFTNAKDAIGKTIIFTTYPGYHGADSEMPDWNSNNKEDWDVAQEFEAVIIGVTASGPSESDSYITEAWAYHLRSRKEFGEPTEVAKIDAEKKNKELSEQAQREGREIQDDEWIKPEPIINTTFEVDEDGFDSILIQVENADKVGLIATKVEEKYEVGAITAQEYLDQILKIFNTVSLILAAIGGIALLVAAVGIINTMVMAVMERTREIGIMKAVGASKKDIRRLFMLEAGLLGFWGGLFGLGVGYGLTIIANYFINDQLASQGFSATNVANLPLWLAFGVLGFTTLLGIIAGLYPAIRAARMNPVDALRRE